MKDTIYREDAILAVHNHFSIYDDPMVKGTLMGVGVVLGTMPSAEPQWIICKDRLPKVGEDVLFAVGDSYTAEGCLRNDGHWIQFRWSSVIDKNEVTAWMQLPAPPKSN